MGMEEQMKAVCMRLMGSDKGIFKVDEPRAEVSEIGTGEDL